MSETVAKEEMTNAGAAGAALATRYDPAEVEARWVRRWVEEPFSADPGSPKPPFTIVIPPPNITGELHLGHAFDNTIIDTLIRFKRMQGNEALFQPGTDHAGISTQVQVEKALKAEGTSRHQIGREAFLERVWAWRERYGSAILEQLQRLGVSAAWERSRFTMDPGLSAAVRLQFITLFHQGKVYRKERIVNWDPISQTVLSDLEVEREERPGMLYELAYQLEAGGEVRIATQRPETIFADVAIAVHPDDGRYAGLIGGKARIPLTDRWIPVISDEAVEMGFGTGALKVTPAHDPLDFEIGERHDLAMPSVIGLDAKLFGELVPEFLRGLDRFVARGKVVEALEGSGELRASQTHSAAIGLSQRTGQPVEPLLSLQWFYDTDDMAKRVLEGLAAGDMRITPERYAKVNTDWLGNLRHWCISRQLWWGHRIPAWYDAAGNIYVPSPEAPDLDPPDDPRYAGIAMTQDHDVFDTWFSSNLWPFSTLGWPDESDPYYRKFYPTSVLVTGYDILFFWVARMQIAGYQFTGRAPFKDVVLHGMVLDAKGQKMSKSKGNGVDPLATVAEYGADALRFACSRASTGAQDIRWDDRLVEMGRNFVTKLWNAARFALMQQSVAPAERWRAAEMVPRPEVLADRWILSRLQRTVAGMTETLEAFDLGAANRLAYDFVWTEFCDWYLEAAKGALREGNPATRVVLDHVLGNILRLLHPLTPFVTSELHQAMGAGTQLAMADWPTVKEVLLDEAAEREFGKLQAVVSAVRALRADVELPPSREVVVHLSGPATAQVAAHAELISGLGRVRLAVEPPDGPTISGAVADLEVALPLSGQVDIGEYRQRQTARLKKLQGELERSERKLASASFVANAPAEVVAEERRRAAEARDVMERIGEVLARLT